ncbi:MAG: arylamine N-acetyltransferase [Caldilineaceae bacterium]
MLDFQPYLNRIQIDKPEAPSYAFLAKLQAQHLLTTPFENLSIGQGERIVLAEDLLVNKLVQRQRGGFCYELNGAFYWLLSRLGFSVTRISARVYSSRQNEFGPEFDHMALIVQLDQPYLVDVGFGDSARQPLALPAGEGADVSGRYRILPVQADHGEYHLQKWEEGGWASHFAFTTTAHELADYGAMCDYHQSSPASHFTQHIVCTRATPCGRLTLSPDSLTITEGDNKEKKAVTSPAEYQQLLFTHFGVRL